MATAHSKMDADSKAQARESKEVADKSAAERAPVNDEVSLDELDGDKAVEHLVSKGWAPTTARRYYNMEDPNYGLAPDLEIGETPTHLKASKLSNSDMDNDPLRDEAQKEK